MRQVQKTLREDHNRNNIHNFGDNSQKKYVKQKIELMKNKGKNIAYTRIPNERKL